MLLPILSLPPTQRGEGNLHGGSIALLFLPFFLHGGFPVPLSFLLQGWSFFLLSVPYMEHSLSPLHGGPLSPCLSSQRGFLCSAHVPGEPPWRDRTKGKEDSPGQ